MYKLIKNKIKIKLLSKQDDVLAKLNLSVFKFTTYLPYSKSSLNYSSLSSLLNDVVINNRTSIIEFGGGISTVYLAKLASITESNIKITTVDHDEVWIGLLKKILEKEGVSEYVNLIHSPLVESKKSLAKNKWYNEEIVKKNIEGLKFDQVIVDGPLAYQKAIQLSRYPALLFINEFLNENNAVFLDDTDRKGEKEIIKLWEKGFKRTFNKLNATSMISFSGSHFNIS